MAYNNVEQGKKPSIWEKLAGGFREGSWTCAKLSVGCSFLAVGFGYIADKIKNKKNSRKN